MHDCVFGESAAPLPEQVCEWRSGQSFGGCPAKILLDNGLELVSVALADWAERRWVELEFIQPGKPTQNPYIERFNQTFRHEMLDFCLFSRLSEVRQVVDGWLEQYNEQRPHESLGDLTLSEFLAINSPEDSIFGWH